MEKQLEQTLLQQQEENVRALEKWKEQVTEIFQQKILEVSFTLYQSCYYILIPFLSPLVAKKDPRIRRGKGEGTQIYRKEQKSHQT